MSFAAFFTSRSGGVPLFLLALLLWFLNHPYQGIQHDARIYGLISAYWLYPESFAGDLFFRFGSQGSLSIFTTIFGAWTKWLGLDAAAWYVVVIGAGLWCTGTLLAARNVLGSGGFFRFAVLMLAVVTVSYSPNGNTFNIGEGFATARSWAIPLAVMSISLLITTQRIWSLVLGLIATALHPLLGIWALAGWILFHTDTRWAIVLCGLPVLLASVLGAMSLDVPGLRLMMGSWLIFVHERVPDVLFRSLGEGNLMNYMGCLAALGLGIRAGSAHVQKLYLRLMLLGCSGLGLALLASFIFPLEIVVQGQAWRVFAILYPFALLALLDVMQRAYRETRLGWPLVLLVAALLTFDKSVWLAAVFIATFGSFIPSAYWSRLVSWLGGRLFWLRLVTGVLWLILLPGLLRDLELAGINMIQPWWDGMIWLHGLLAGGGWLGPTVLAVIPMTRSYWKPIYLGVVSLILVFALLIALTAWDRRPHKIRKEEACYLNRNCPPHPFGMYIKEGHSVYWPNEELTIWFMLHRSSYYGSNQNTGAVFSEEKFTESLRRGSHVSADRSPLHLCSDPILDWLVLPHADMAPDLVPRAVWQEVGLFSCADIQALKSKLIFHDQEKDSSFVARPRAGEAPSL